MPKLSEQELNDLVMHATERCVSALAQTGNLVEDRVQHAVYLLRVVANMKATALAAVTINGCPERVLNDAVPAADEYALASSRAIVKQMRETLAAEES